MGLGVYNPGDIGGFVRIRTVTVMLQRGRSFIARDTLRPEWPACWFRTLQWGRALIARNTFPLKQRNRYQCAGRRYLVESNPTDQRSILQSISQTSLCDAGVHHRSSIWTTIVFPCSLHLAHILEAYVRECSLLFPGPFHQVSGVEIAILVRRCAQDDGA